MQRGIYHWLFHYQELSSHRTGWPCEDIKYVNLICSMACTLWKWIKGQTKQKDSWNMWTGRNVWICITLLSMYFTNTTERYVGRIFVVNSVPLAVAKHPAGCLLSLLSLIKHLQFWKSEPCFSHSLTKKLNFGYNKKGKHCVLPQHWEGKWGPPWGAVKRKKRPLRGINAPSVPQCPQCHITSS